MTLDVYGHVIDELEDTPGVDAEQAIRAARGASGTHLVPIAAAGA
jgi:hypothetical protein